MMMMMMLLRWGGSCDNCFRQQGRTLTPPRSAGPCLPYCCLRLQGSSKVNSCRSRFFLIPIFSHFFMLSGSPRGTAGKRSHFSRPFRFLPQTHPSLQTISLWHKNNDTFANPRQCKNNFPGPSILFHLTRSLSLLVRD